MSDAERSFEQVSDDDQDEKNVMSSGRKSEEYPQISSRTFQRNSEDSPEFKMMYDEAVEDSAIEEEIFDKNRKLSMDLEEQINPEIHLSIIGYESVGSALSKHTVYQIRGHDKNGQISVSRRFNQFFNLRMALVKRWPGCFIPSIPSKNLVMKNDNELTRRRSRYLNDFLQKIIRITHLYNSQEFQCLLRSSQADISDTISKWPNPTAEEVIIKYRDCFEQLAGKEINQATINSISVFMMTINKNKEKLVHYRDAMKHLAESRERFDFAFPSLFEKTFPCYEKLCLEEYVNGKDEDAIYNNLNNDSLIQHATIAKQSVKFNPYWMLYDLIKHEERDGTAFLECLQSRQAFQSKKNRINSKINDNKKKIQNLNAGKKSIKGMTTKNTNDQMKYKLEVENQQLKKQQCDVEVLSDIITALIAFVEMERYRKQKEQFYKKVIRKIGSHQITRLQKHALIWQQTKKIAKLLRTKHANI